MEIQMVNGVIEPAETEEDIESESATMVTVPQQAWTAMVEQNRQMQAQIRNLELRRGGPLEKTYNCGVNVVVHVQVTRTAHEAVDRQAIANAIQTLTPEGLVTAIGQWSTESIDPVDAAAQTG
ncbi:hypothetical protein [Mycobacteroides abscessus]|uniref:hypothetical protein n=1 Tax=Mycobacteroides abscessus TaxID=36809 RepID=UPI0009A713E1|nr:hypothetical protein [Mycobacteroides abscessus]